MSTELDSGATSAARQFEEDKAKFRRDFMRGVAAIVGVGAAAKIAAAQTSTTPPAPSAANDLNLLNYALTLEYLEATFYTQGLQRFSSADFANAAFSRNLQQASGIGSDAPLSGAYGTGLAQDVYGYLSVVRNHEQQHVRTLQNVIRANGGTPVDAPRFNFNFTSAEDFIGTAALLENTGVAAYNGAIPMMFSTQLITASATIATVEARHAAYLNRLRGQNPFPDAVDAGRTMAEILQAANQFIVP
ncbi:MAG TPA: ferritin-like domain-containing protein [Bryobacteraceae bacterium]|nr:ferritin-like domain-containing protein [Bryobacteraceae bacterium]